MIINDLVYFKRKEEEEAAEAARLKLSSHKIEENARSYSCTANASADHIHSGISLSTSFSLSIYLPTYLSIYTSILSLSLYLSLGCWE